jgi:DNA-binding NtrC family response regulator
VRRRDGRFKAANHGTLLLDEVAEIPLSAQAKLLRVLEQGRVEPLGDDTPCDIDVRIVSATHQDLKQRIAEGRFREDLYYRLNVIDLVIPPLRERREDLPCLVAHFLERAVPAGHATPTIAPRAWAAMLSHPFPGNVRELKHAVERAVVLARGREIELDCLPPDLAGTPLATVERADGFEPLAPAMRRFERGHLERALELAGRKKAHAAELLGISRKSLWQKLRSHDVPAPLEDDAPDPFAFDADDPTPIDPIDPTPQRS